MQTRSEHLQWCKDRANAYFEKNNITEGCSSFYSDMKKHPDTSGHSALELMFQMQIGGHLNTSESAKEFVNGFN